MNSTQIKLIFSIFGDYFSPEEITRIAELTPTKFWFKGDIVTSQKKMVARQESCWLYEINFMETLLLEEVLKIYVKKFTRNIDKLSSFILEKKLETKIDIVIEIIDNQIPSLTFDRNFLMLINNIEAEVDIDMYLIDSTQL